MLFFDVFKCTILFVSFIWNKKHRRRKKLSFSFGYFLIYSAIHWHCLYFVRVIIFISLVSFSWPLCLFFLFFLHILCFFLIFFVLFFVLSFFFFFMLMLTTKRERFPLKLEWCLVGYKYIDICLCSFFWRFFVLWNFYRLVDSSKWANKRIYTIFIRIKSHKLTV